jgi:PEP-CTERM motif
MINQKTILSAVAAFALSAALSRGTEFFNFSVVPGASIQFNGTASSFQFNNNTTNGHQWSITTEGGGSGALGLQGAFTGGPWIYGAVTVNGLVQSAVVNPTLAGLTINDGAGHLATANVTWVDVTTMQSAGFINASAVVNLSNLSYTGANADLHNFFSAPAGSLDLSFQFNPTMTLSQLSLGTGPYTNSYSGSMSPVPEPASLLILGAGFLLLGGRAVIKRSERN